LSLSFCFYLNAISTFFLNFSLWSLSYKFHIIIREPHIDINGACASNWTVPKKETKSSIHIHNGIIIIFNHFSVSFCFCLCHVIQIVVQSYQRVQLTLLSWRLNQLNIKLYVLKLQPARCGKKILHYFRHNCCSRYMKYTQQPEMQTSTRTEFSCYDTELSILIFT
jgi:hypothetical protein